MRHDIEQTRRRYVWVVETWLKNQRRWYSWSASTQRSLAWAHARESRERFPGERFRVTKYVSTKP